MVIRKIITVGWGLQSSAMVENIKKEGSRTRHGMIVDGTRMLCIERIGCVV